MFDVARSCLYAHRERARHIDVERMALRGRVHELFVESRSSAGSRSIMGMMREEGTAIGRFKVSRLMEELGLVCKQPGSHAYKQATVERVDIPNHLNREFTVEAPPSVKIVVASSNWSSNLPWGDGFDDDKIHQREERACAQPDERAA